MRTIEFFKGNVFVVLLLGSIWLALGGSATAQSLYQPSMKREMSRQDRWDLDLKLANEGSMKNHNSREFEAPQSFEKRAQWFESTAKWYPIADLMQQMIDFRRSVMVNDEAAFNRLVGLGLNGDIGATCIAAMFYKHFSTRDTAKWKYSYEQVVSQALKVKDSGHPVCAGLEGELFITGELGYRKDRRLAHPFMVIQALSGLYGAQEYLASEYQAEALKFQPREFELNLCWRKVADNQSAMSGFRSLCDSYQAGTGFNEKFQPVALPGAILPIARSWCDSSLRVTAKTCAALEQNNR